MEGVRRRPAKFPVMMNGNGSPQNPRERPENPGAALAGKARGSVRGCLASLNLQPPFRELLVLVTLSDSRAFKASVVAVAARERKRAASCTWRSRNSDLFIAQLFNRSGPRVFLH